MKSILNLQSNGEVYRDDKLIATISGSDITFKHHAFKKHEDEIKSMMENAPQAMPQAIPAAITPGDQPQTPAHLFLEGNGRWYGEENPPVVLWRKENWSLEAYDSKYGHQQELLRNNFKAEGMSYEG